LGLLKLTKKADYGLIALKHLADSGPGAAMSANEIGEAYGLPQEALAKILQRLAKAGLLISHQGTRGGYSLARNARMISAFEVIQAIDGPVFFTSCGAHDDCSHTSRCNVKEPLRKVSESIKEVLSRLTLDQMRDDRVSNGGEKKISATLVNLTF